MVNVAQGHAEPVDVAKIFREIGPERAASELHNLPVGQAVIRDGRDLAKLSDEAFGAVVNGAVEPSHAAAVGRLIDDPAEQLAAIGYLARHTPANANEARLIVEQMRDAGFAKKQQGAQGGLFGEESDAETLFAERAKVIDQALKLIRQDRQAFATLTREADAIEAAGNTLVRDVNSGRLAADQRLEGTVRALANRKGPISDAINEAAAAVRAGKPAAAAARDVLGAIRSAAPAGGTGGAAGRGIGSADEGAGQRQDASDEAVGADEKLPFQRRASNDIEALSAAIAKQIGQEVPEGGFVPAVLPNAGPLGRIAAAFGKRIVGFRVGGQHRSLLGFFDGVVLPSHPDVIYIRADAINPHLQVLGHELLHRLRREAPDLYDELASDIRAIIDQKGFSKGFAARLLAVGERREALSEEFVAELVSEGFLDRRFWDALGKESPSLLAKIRDALARAIEAVRRRLLGQPRHPVTERYLRDYAKALGLAGRAMARYGGRAGQPQRAERGPATFNRSGKTDQGEGRTIPDMNRHLTPAQVRERFKVRPGRFGGFEIVGPDGIPWNGHRYGTEQGAWKEMGS